LLGTCERWEEALSDAERAASVAPHDPGNYYRLATLQAKCGHSDQHRQHSRLCQRALDEFANTQGPSTADLIARACTILQPDNEHLPAISALADIALAAEEKYEDFPSNQFCKGLVEYRQGHYKEAKTWMSKTLGHGNSDLGALAVMAMAQYSLNENGEARATLAKANSLFDGGRGIPADYLAWQDWLYANILLGEARALLAQERPGTHEAGPNEQGG
jgi:tetratricopeptide (TPR) repeat protein